jgi:hypothetical protein
MKRAYVVMRPDPNFPGLQVCDEGCADQKDPYRLPARKTERINLRFPRPDVSVAVDPNSILSNGVQQIVLSTEQNTEIPENDGNVDGINLQPSP